MRQAFFILIFLLCLRDATAQHLQPEIVGQKDLSTASGQSISIALSDLHVKESPVEGSDDEPGEGDDDETHDENTGEGEDGDGGDTETPNEDDEDDDEDDEDEGDSDSDEDDGKVNEEDDDNKGKDKNKGNDGGERDDDGDKGKGKKDKNKGKGHGKGGNGRTSYPDGYSLEIFPGKNYTFSGNTVTPDAAFSGTLTVGITVKNQKYSAPRYDLIIFVLPAQNKVPVITGQLPVATLRDTTVEIKLSHLTVTDEDNEYPRDFSLLLTPGENYGVEKTTVVPASGFTGTLTVPLIVNDGQDNSAPFDFKVSVTAAGNAVPVITGHMPLSISRNQSVDLVLSHLLVEDPDNTFPDDFTLHVHEGDRYTAAGTTVTPESDYTGDISVNVSVSDGAAESAVYTMKITVAASANHKPVISGQATLKVAQGETLEITLSHLVVEDKDNAYPADFLLNVLPGDNYVTEKNTITPSRDFLGMLTVQVTVHDGKDTSLPFALKIEVFRKDRLVITGHRPLEMEEDTTVTLSLSDLTVNDPSNTYPAGFTLQVMNGENYATSNVTIRPNQNFYGDLSVLVTVSKDGTTSAGFNILIVVNPVNDPPALDNFDTDPLVISSHGSWPLMPGAEITDVDDDHLLFAEAGFDPQSYQQGADRLDFQPAGNIHGVFDENKGILFLVGRASLGEYRELIRSIAYSYSTDVDAPQHAGSKSIYVKVNDGKATSPSVERLVIFDGKLELDIPSAFTPNQDQANDTWKITLRRNADELKTFIRVYDSKGVMVFESRGLEREWDGYYNGVPLPAGAYFYAIELDASHGKVNYKGVVSLLR